METIEIENVTLTLAHPDKLNINWTGQNDLVRQITAAWMKVDITDIPLNPRIVGKPGAGKTTLSYYVATQVLKQEAYIFQCTIDTRPEDLIIMPVISSSNTINYHASSLLTAMIKGGVAILDEGNRMSEKSWASLAPLLDDRKYVESVIAGIKIKAHPDFRIIITMNDDATTFDLPEYIHSRLQPTIELPYPDGKEEYDILKMNIPFADDVILNITVDFLQKAHNHNTSFSVRDGINIARYAMKLYKSEVAENKNTAFTMAIKAVLGADGLRLLAFRPRQDNQ